MFILAGVLLSVLLALTVECDSARSHRDKNWRKSVFKNHPSIYSFLFFFHVLSNLRSWLEEEHNVDQSQICFLLLLLF